MKKAVSLATAALIGGLFSTVMAQIPGERIPPRVEDHFWRRKVVNRIDLSEKINEPLIASELLSLYGPTAYGGAYGERNGVVQALINGLKSGKYLAYDPDSLTKSLTYDDVVKKAQAQAGEGGGGDEGWDSGDEGFDDFSAEEDFGSDEFGDGGGDGFDDMGGDTPAAAGSGDDGGDFSLAAYETVLQFIEDRIFDKNRSDMVYDLQYIQLVWVDPSETLPDKNFVCFKYADVLETLEDTQWKNKYNDAEYRNMREIFELRLFNSYIINVSGRGVRTLEESDFRRNQLVEFEHHLWCY
jgi:hypothetical protein